jgi:hypothetical protein
MPPLYLSKAGVRVNERFRRVEYLFLPAFLPAALFTLKVLLIYLPRSFVPMLLSLTFWSSGPLPYLARSLPNPVLTANW